MAQPTVKTVQYIDPRIEPQPDPVYDYIIGPTQNQYYKIAASGKSNSSLTFNNLTTLGVDRAYLDTFEIELGVEITFYINDSVGAAGSEQLTDPNDLFPTPDMFTFQSFPFNSCCDEARVNINGGAFFSQPMCYVRAKERYMNQRDLSRCYENICPCHRPELQFESGAGYSKDQPPADLAQKFNPISTTLVTTTVTADGKNVLQTAALRTWGNPSLPTRFGKGMHGYMQSSEGMNGGFNNSIIKLGNTTVNGYTNFYRDDTKIGTRNDVNKACVLKVTWREPLFVSPFSSRYDATYGRPLYNITSMDFAFNLMDLGNIIRLKNYSPIPYVKDYTVNITSAMLCYQVMTIPAILQKPLTTLVPYRRFVPYITDFDQQVNNDGAVPAQTVPITGATDITVRSGVYTLNEIPTAIWVFAAPVKALYQTNPLDKKVSDATGITTTNANTFPAWDNNKLFGYLKHINISMANTTQILNTAQPVDLYRIAKANGCEDSYWSWGGSDVMFPKAPIVYPAADGWALSPTGPTFKPQKMVCGAGSVLRLKPGVDILVPDIPLIPGANASNMVFQVEAKFDIPEHSFNSSKYALWLLFEYVGVAAISPGQCEITMNPLGSGDVMSVSPILSATSEATEGKLEGAGFWDGVKRAATIGRQIAEDGVLSKILRRIPGAGRAADFLQKHGFGEEGTCKRRRLEGGAVMGRGINDWI